MGCIRICRACIRMLEKQTEKDMDDYMEAEIT